MKIFLFNNNYEPYARGGAEEVVKTAALGLSRAGHEVTVVTAAVDKEKKYQIDGYQIITLLPLNIFSFRDLGKHGVFTRLLWHFFDVYNFSISRKVKKILDEEKPDLILAHNLKGLCFRLPKIARKSNIHLYQVLHDVQLAVPSGLIIKNQEKSWIVSGLLAKIYARICRNLFASPEKVFSPSHWLLKFYVERGFFPKSEKIVLRNPALRENIAVLPRRGKKGRYLFVGQLTEHKGIAWLINFWFKTRLEKELWVVGDGPLNLSALRLPTVVKLLGRKTPDEILKLLEEVDFLIVPSLCYENSPTVIQLAFAAGVPVLSVDLGGAGELVTEGQTGFLFSAGDEVSFAQAYHLSRRVTDDQFAAMSRACIQKASEFSVDKYLDGLLPG